jgi:hypothetical protein
LIFSDPIHFVLTFLKGLFSQFSPKKEEEESATAAPSFHVSSGIK